MKPRRKEDILSDRPPHDPQHDLCSPCTAWRVAQKLGITYRKFIRSHPYAYDENGNHPPFVPQRQP